MNLPSKRPKANQYAITVFQCCSQLNRPCLLSKVTQQDNGFDEFVSAMISI